MSRAKAEMRRRIQRRANFQCEYCRSPQEFLLADLELDHIRPKGRGGKTVEDNLCAACRKCNQFKGMQMKAVDPESGKLQPLFNPRTQPWDDHFEFSPDGNLIMGQTAIGRATIAVLQLNRRRAVLLRRMWRKAGWHPPRR